MCIGLPMQVRALAPGHADCEGRGERRRVRTALVDGGPQPLAVGDWVLVFIDSATERLSAERAAEVGATLDLLAAALQAPAGPDLDAAFDLPSSWSAEALQALVGAAVPPASSPMPVPPPVPIPALESLQGS